MLVIRLSRTGRKKQPYYRVVVAEKSAGVKRHYVEALGHFNPRTKELKIDVDRAKAVLKNGAQPSETAEFLLEKAGVLKREAVKDDHRRPTRKKRKEMKAEAAEGGAPAAEAAPADAAEPKAQEAKDQPAKDEKPDAKQPAAKQVEPKKEDVREESKEGEGNG